MKKIILSTVMIFSMVLLTGCGNTKVKSDNLDIELNLPGGNWESVADDANSYIVSDDKNMISYNITDVPNGYKMAATQEELFNLLGEEVMAVSEIEDFNYTSNDDGTEQSLYYKQIIGLDNNISTVICHNTIKGNKLMTATATLVDGSPSEITEIENIIKENTVN